MKPNLAALLYHHQTERRKPVHKSVNAMGGARLDIADALQVATRLVNSFAHEGE